MFAICRAPRREEHTIWTAVAPDEIFTVRTLDDEPAPDEHRLVRRIWPSGSESGSEAAVEALKP